MKHLKIHKFPLKNVIVLAIECKMYLKTLKCITLVLKHLHGDRAAAILLKMDIRH